MFDRLLRRARDLIPEPVPATPCAPAAAASVDWSRLRAPPKDRDRVLLSDTHLWLRRIPTPLHPKHLCRYHPRIANRLAQAWDDPVATDRLFDDLLVDRRGKRKGFPERILMEIRRLQQFHDRRPRLDRLRPLTSKLRGWASGPLGPNT